MSEDEVRINNECSSILQGDLDMSCGFTTVLCLVLEPISVFLTKTGESSSPVQWSSPVVQSSGPVQ